MKNQEGGMKKDIAILKLIDLKITNYLNKSVYISDLIYDLESYLNQLITVDAQWKKDFRTVWLDIEVAYSLALDQGLENLTNEGAALTENSLLNLKKMTQNKIVDLRERKNEDESYHCRVCGLKQDFKPWGEDGQCPTYDICDCCGTEFGYGDCTLKAIQASRERWLAKDAEWRYPEEKPANWSLEEQMKDIPEEFC